MLLCFKKNLLKATDVARAHAGSDERVDRDGDEDDDGDVRARMQPCVKLLMLQGFISDPPIAHADDALCDDTCGCRLVILNAPEPYRLDSSYNQYFEPLRLARDVIARTRLLFGGSPEALVPRNVLGTIAAHCAYYGRWELKAEHKQGFDALDVIFERAAALTAPPPSTNRAQKNAAMTQMYGNSRHINAVSSQQRGADDTLYCVCQERDDGTSDMVCCDNADCDYRWWHRRCISAEGFVVPKLIQQKQWTCPRCTIAQRSVRRRKMN